METEFGIAFQTDKPPGRYAPLAAAAEEHGFDVVSVFADLLYQPPLPALLEMARATHRVRLGTACLNPYTVHPYEIAGQAAALAEASGGRAYLGLARGAWLGAIGLSQPRPLRRLREAAAVIRALLAGDAAGYAGEEFWLAPGTRLRTAASLAAGRPADVVRIVAGAVTVVAENGAEARRRARAEVAMYLAVVGALDTTAQLPEGLAERIADLVAVGDDAGAGAWIPDDVLDRFAFSGTPDQVAAQAHAVVGAGAGRVDFGTPHGLTGAEGVTLLGTRVLPLLRGMRAVP